MKQLGFAFYVLLISFLFLNSATTFSQFKHYTLDDSKSTVTPEQIIPDRSFSEEPGSVTISYKFQGYSVSDIQLNKSNYQLIHFEGFGYNSEPGTPSLPSRSEKIAIPANMSVRISVIDADYKEIEGFRIAPAQKYYEDGDVSVHEFVINEKLYSSNDLYPQNIVELRDIQTMRGVPIAIVDINPVQYNPTTGQVRIYKNLTFQLSFIPSANKTTIDPKSVAPNQIVKNIVLNSDAIQLKASAEKSGNVVDKTGYLIVTTPKFATAADTLAKWKRQMGFKVEIISQASWTIAQVKTAVRSRYDSWTPKPEYLLVLGDQEDVPAYYYRNEGMNWDIYSTLYYVCMDGANDYYPEMAHGRITARSNNEALAIIRKIINYEKYPPVDPGFYNKGLHAAYFEDKNPKDGYEDLRYTASNVETSKYMESLGFTCDKVYYTEPGVNPTNFSAYFSGNMVFPSELKRSNGFAWDGDKYDIIDAINNGRLYAFHRDHGLIHEWVNPQIDTVDLNNLTNGNETPVVFSINCETGSFWIPQPNQCFAEKFLSVRTGGAVGVFAPTEATVSGFNDALIEGMIDAIWSSPGLLPNFGTTYTVVPHDPIYAMGDVLVQGLIRMDETWKEEWCIKDHFHDYHYFGDPAMHIWTGVPVTTIAQHPASIEVGATSITISGSNCPDGIATVLYKNNQSVKIQLENGSGTIHFSEAIDASVTEVILTITKHNFRPYIAKIRVNSVPIVAFSANTTDICPAGIISFTDESENNPTAWTWSISPANFSCVDGTSLNSENPTIRFNNSGIYSISLTATNIYGSVLLEKQNYIHVALKPAAPLSSNASMCSDALIPQLLAIGDNMKWYANEQLSDMLFEGSGFTPSSVVEGENHFFVTQTIGICESEPTDVILTQFPPTSNAVTSDYTFCDYDSVLLIAEGNEINWYTDEFGEDFIQSGDSLALLQQEAGQYTYYVSNTSNGCESEFLPVTVNVNPQPEPPLTTEYESCFGSDVTLTVDGENVKWYEGSEKNYVIATGNDLILNNPVVGGYTYYVTQTISDCESEQIGVSLIVNSLPVVNLGSDTIIYLGDTLTLTVPETGEFLWSDGSSSGTYHFIADAFGIGYHETWVDFSDSNSCQTSDSITIEVKTLVDIPRLEDGNYLFIYPNPTNGLLNVEFPQAAQQASVTFTDSQGRVISVFNFDESYSQPLHVIDLSGMKKGIYFMTVYNAGLPKTVKVMVK